MLLQEFKLSYVRHGDVSSQPVLTNSVLSADLIRSLYPADTLEMQEHFICVYMNQENRLIGWHHLSTGGVTGTVADPRLIFSVGVQCGATGVILSHNHPSGNIKPSQADKLITQKIKNAGEMIDIKVLDHIIITATDHYSFADEGLI